MPHSSKVRWLRTQSKGLNLLTMYLAMNQKLAKGGLKLLTLPLWLFATIILTTANFGLKQKFY